jgi:hypothetical protein
MSLSTEEDEGCCDWNGRYSEVKDYDGIYEVFYCPICGKHTVEKIADYDD